MSVSSILLITTNQNECDSLNEAFTTCGVRVDCVNTASDTDVIRFMDKALTNGWDSPSLIILDLDDSHGYRTSVLSKIKQHTYSFRTPLLVFSQNSDSMFVERLYQQGVTSFFKRPHDWNYFAQNLFAYWSYIGVQLPNEPRGNNNDQQRGSSQSSGLTYYPRSQGK